MAANWISLGFHDDDMITLFTTINKSRAASISNKIYSKVYEST